MATGVIQVGDVDGWTQGGALKEERRLRWWIYFEDGDELLASLDVRCEKNRRVKEESTAFGLGNWKDTAAIN